MDYLLVGVNIDRQAVWCVHYWHCVFIRCVGGYIIVYNVIPWYCNCWDYLLLHEDWGECSEDWAGVCRWGGGWGGIFNWKKKFAKKCSWGLKTQKKKKRGGGQKFLSFFFPTKLFFGGGGILGCLGRPTPPPGGHAGSENDTLLPMTMICDRLKFWSGPAWRSKVIIRKPWRRKILSDRVALFLWTNPYDWPTGHIRNKSSNINKFDSHSQWQQWCSLAEDGASLLAKQSYININ